MSICKYISNDGLCLLHSETFYKEPCIEGPCHDYTAMTNAEHIRTMTDVKLAELFADVGACFYDDADVCEKWNGACDKCWLDWLKQEIDCGADMREKEEWIPIQDPWKGEEDEQRRSNRNLIRDEV